MGPPPAPPCGPPEVTRTSGTLQGFHMAAAFCPGQGHTAGTVHGGDSIAVPFQTGHESHDSSRRRPSKSRRSSQRLALPHLDSRPAIHDTRELPQRATLESDRTSIPPNRRTIAGHRTNIRERSQSTNESEQSATKTTSNQQDHTTRKARSV